MGKSIQTLMEHFCRQFNLLPENINITTVYYSKNYEVDDDGFVNANGEVSRMSDEEVISIIVKYNKNHLCGLKYQIVAIVIWNGYSTTMSNDLV